jgi:hypothetical protein
VRVQSPYHSALGACNNCGPLADLLRGHGCLNALDYEQCAIYLFEAAGVLLTRVSKWSAPKAWG